jgi:hypothetical protein
MPALTPGRDETKVLQGAINLIARVIPLIFEDKEFFMRSMWHEQSFFNNQINAIRMMDSLSALLFKPGFTITPYKSGHDPQIGGIDPNLVWKSGISVLEATNHAVTKYDGNRIILLRTIIALLSQPLFYSPEEYLVVLNPFSTFLTNRRCKNTKNLFVSLVNMIISYDCVGYGIPFISTIDTQGDRETLTTLCLHLLLIMIEYKPPSIDNLRYLINGGHPSLKKIYGHFISHVVTQQSRPEEIQAMSQAVIEDLTVNEYYRLFKVVHGKMNLDPLYTGLSQYF